MKNIKHVTHLAIFTVMMVVAITSCKDEHCDNPSDPACPNYDPCLGLKKANAAFEIFDTIICGDNLKSLWQSFEVDTCYPRDVWFRALHDNDTYEWKIGYDPRVFTDKTFPLYINVPGDITIRLVTTKKHFINQCFTGNTTRDTSYRTIHIAKYDQIAPIYGKYLGHDVQNPAAQYVVEIKSPQEAGVYSGVYGLPEGCLKLINPPLASDLYESWRYGVIADSDINCFEPQGVAEVSSDYNSIIIDYTIRTDFTSNNRMVRRFVGVRQ
jgi:hypothetical protein